MDKLKEKNIWILWKLINGKNGKPTKMPFAFNGNSTGTNSEYSNTWVNYNKAIENVNLQNASGIGFVIPKNYFFLDIDHNDIDSPLAKEMLNRFDTYAEYSRSHNGIHIYGIVDGSKLPIDDIKNKKFYMKNSNLNLELYIGGLTNRFACFTGNAIKDINLKDYTDAIIKTLNNEMLKDCKSDNEIINLLKTQSNANKFINLFEKGDINGNGSQFEADLALCSMIAFRTGNNTNLIDKVFRKSKLCRDKWINREDYRNQTIKRL